MHHLERTKRMESRENSQHVDFRHNVHNCLQKGEQHLRALPIELSTCKATLCSKTIWLLNAVSCPQSTTQNQALTDSAGIWFSEHLRRVRYAWLCFASRRACMRASGDENDIRRWLRWQLDGRRN